MVSYSFTSGPEAEAIRLSVQRRGIIGIWHLGRLAQLRSIFERGGILSRAKMDELGIQYGMSGWGTVAKAQEMRDYICCSLVPPWGMSRQDPDTKVLLTLHPRLTWRSGTLFSGAWSSYGHITLSQLKRNYTAAAFDALFDNPTTGFPSPAPGELLIPDMIPVADFLQCIYFHSAQAK